MPSLNGKAKSFHKMVNLNEQELQQSSALRNLTDKQVEALYTFPLKMYNPCHNQAVERYINAVRGFHASYRFSKNKMASLDKKLKSMTLMKGFDTKR